MVYVIEYTDETRDRKESGEDHKRIVYMKIFSAVVYGRRLKRSGDPTHSHDGGVLANEAVALSPKCGRCHT